MQLEIASSPLLKKLFQQPALLRIGPNNQDQLLPALREPLRQLFPGPHLLLRSLGNGSRVVMLVLADLGRPAVQRPACPGLRQDRPVHRARDPAVRPPAPHGMRDMPGTLVRRVLSVKLLPFFNPGVLACPFFSDLPLVIEPSDLAARLGAPELILVDLTSAARYAEGHIPGARFVDPKRTQWGQPPAPGLLPAKADLEALFGELGHRPEATYVVYDDEGGGWAAASSGCWT
ncbi:thiosulfate sulfurtransferase [Pseudomonas aeruginosa]|nr:thiosulfate sulfurtransferase [Pseudomonas aeruginosa]